jgi:uncharacterized protein (TIGR00299 family) protein
MKTAYFDCQFGAAGDMLLGACLAAGVVQQDWLKELEKIALPKDAYTVKIETTTRCTLACTKVSILDKTHNNGHDHHHDHKDQRDLGAINKIIEDSRISSKAKGLALAIFSRLAQAEGRVHGQPALDVHFHEIGAIDSIIDIVGFAIAYEMLGIERAIVSPLPLGSGTVETQHGLFPVPGPAVLELLKDARAPILEVNLLEGHECLTPTGAAILAEIAASWGGAQLESIEAIGYGAGSFNSHKYPNVVRLLLGEGAAHANPHLTSRFASETVAVLETNIDDLSPQALAFAAEELMKEGALDVYVTACLMKKGRSGHLLTVICEPKDSDAFKETIMLKTPTLGVRERLLTRIKAERQFQTIELDGGQRVRIKVASDLRGNAIHIQPEYEDCAEICRSAGLPFSEVYEQALAKYRKKTAASQRL